MRHAAIQTKSQPSGRQESRRLGKRDPEGAEREGCEGEGKGKEGRGMVSTGSMKWCPDGWHDVPKMGAKSCVENGRKVRTHSFPY